MGRNYFEKILYATLLQRALERLYSRAARLVCGTRTCIHATHTRNAHRCDPYNITTAVLYSLQTRNRVHSFQCE